MARKRELVLSSQIAASGSAPTDSAIHVSRRRVNGAFLNSMHAGWLKYGDKAMKEAAEQTPASFLKAFCLLMPKDIRIEQTSPTSVLSDEQLGAMITELEERIAARIAAGEGAKVIEGQAVSEPPKRKRGRPRKVTTAP